MSEHSSRLGLPFLMPSQAQKHVTHNEALQKLDILVQTIVENFDATVPPALPAEGATWALGAAPLDEWVGHGFHLATWTNGAWLFTPLKEGFVAVETGGAEILIWDGTGWKPSEISDVSNLNGVGINTGFDATNRLSVSSPATLLTHEGAGHQVKVNKATEGDTASLLFQTNWSGRAEMGTSGNDEFSIKVSPDGMSWTTGLKFEPITGRPVAPEGLEVNGTISGTAVTQNAVDSTSGRLLKTGDFGLGHNAGPMVSDLDAHTTSGMYYFFGGLHANAASGDNPFAIWSGAVGLLCGNGALGGAGEYQWQMAFKLSGTSAEVKVRSREASTMPFTAWMTFHTSGNTTVDANGFIKEASPIIRLFDCGIEMPCIPVDATFSRLGVGKYCLENVEPLSTRGWQIEVPQDANGNRLVFVDTEYDSGSRCLTVNTSAIAWKGAWTAGEPLDIPGGRWIDLRFHAAEELPDSQQGEMA